jgi:hypothetical protein
MIILVTMLSLCVSAQTPDTLLLSPDLGKEGETDYMFWSINHLDDNFTFFDGYFGGIFPYTENDHFEIRILNDHGIDLASDTNYSGQFEASYNDEVLPYNGSDCEAMELLGSWIAPTTVIIEDTTLNLWDVIYEFYIPRYMENYLFWESTLEMNYTFYGADDPSEAPYLAVEIWNGTQYSFFSFHETGIITQYGFFMHFVEPKAFYVSITGGNFYNDSIYEMQPDIGKAPGYNNFEWEDYEESEIDITETETNYETEIAFMSLNPVLPMMLILFPVILISRGKR